MTTAAVCSTGSDLDVWLTAFLNAVWHKTRRTRAPLHLQDLVGLGERLQIMTARSGVSCRTAMVRQTRIRASLLKGIAEMAMELIDPMVLELVAKLVISGVIGGFIGFERRAHHKPIGIAGMVMVAIGSTTYMLLAQQLMATDPSSVSRTLQGFLSGIGFLGGAVIFKSGFDVKGIKAAAAVWITGAVGLAIAMSYWLLGVTVGIATALVMFVADSFPDPVRVEKQEPKPRADKE